MAKPDNSNANPTMGGDFEKSRLLIEEARAKLDLFFTKDYWNFDDVLRVMYYYWYEDAEIESEKEFILQQMEMGKDVLNDSGFRQEFKISTMKQFRMLIYSDLYDTLSRLGNLDPFVKMPGITDRFDDKSPEFFLRQFKEWGFGVITGRPNAGKSNFACTLIEMGLGMGFKIATNIKIDNAPENVFFTTSFTKLLLHCVTNFLNGHRTLIFMDEVPQFFTRKRSTSDKYLSFEKILFLLRKMGGNLISIVQRPADVPSVLQDFSQTRFQKIEKSVVMIEKEMRPGFMKIYVLNNVPGTKLEYQTYHSASFQIDLDIETLQNYLASIEDDENQLETIKDYLEFVISNQTDTVNFEAMEIITIKFLRDFNRMPYDRIGDIIGRSESEVKTKYNRGKKGEVVLMAKGKTQTPKS